MHFLQIEKIEKSQGLNFNAQADVFLFVGYLRKTCAKFAENITIKRYKDGEIVRRLSI